MNDQTAQMNERNAATVYDARAERCLAYPVLGWSLAMLLGGLFLALVGATDSYYLPIWVRLGIWLSLCMIAALLGLAIEAGLLRTGVSWKSPLAWWSILSVALALTMTPFIFLVNSITGAEGIEMVPVFLRNAVIISGALVALRMTIGVLFHQNRQFSTPEFATPKLLDRLSIGLRNGQLYAIGSEGHYSRIWTDLGDELVLVRLKDAIAETSPVEGLQVHRSWWVAKDAVEDVAADGSRARLSLKNGEEIPVSRSRKSALRDLGWL